MHPFLIEQFAREHINDLRRDIERARLAHPSGRALHRSRRGRVRSRLASLVSARPVKPTPTAVVPPRLTAVRRP